MRSKVKLQGQRDMVGQLQFAFVAYDEVHILYNTHKPFTTVT